VNDVIIRSDRFGEIEIEPDRLIEFSDGILGFPESRRFAMLDANDTGLYFWLQCVEDPALAFLSVIPWEFFPEYTVDLSDDIERSLAVAAESDVLVLALVTVQADTRELTANLLGPLVINVVAKRGCQLVLADSGFSVRAPLQVA
jgi:flagellar assembly factor FliW